MQGSSTAPQQFNMAGDEPVYMFMQEAEAKGWGLGIGVERTRLLLFAKQFSLLSSSASELAEMVAYWRRCL